MVFTLLDELRWAARHVRRRPLFAIAVTAALGVAIAVATTTFGLASAVLWKPLPFDDPSKLVFAWEEVDRDGHRQPTRVTAARFAAWRDSSSGFASMSLFGAAGFRLDAADGATSVRGVRVSANYFQTLGVRPALGRTFAAADEMPGNHRVVILSETFWRERFGARRDAVGETVRLSGEPYTIVGVMPRLTFPAWPVNPATTTLDAESRQFWVPIARVPGFDRNARGHVFGVVARLAPDVSLSEAVNRLNATADPAAPDPHAARLEPLRDHFVREARTPLVALAGAALAVLLIACANLAALFVSAFEARRMELAVRAALGAALTRLVRQLSFEALLLVAAGAAIGTALARAALAWLPDLLPPTIPFLTAPALDVRVASFAAALGLLATMMVTAWPIARLVGAAPLPRGASTRPRTLIYRVLVIGQIGLTLGLSAAAGLLAQSLLSVERQHPGFTIERVFVADIALPTSAPSSARSFARAEQDLLDAVAARPNVRAVAAAYDHPLEANWSESPTIRGDAQAGDERHPAELRIVSPGYFEALGVALLEGRTFTVHDSIEAPGVALVNEAFARELGGGVVGRRLRSGTPRLLFNDAPGEFEIVGVVNNERFRGLEHPAQPAFYLSTRQFPQSSFVLLVRTAGPALAASADIRTAVRGAGETITFARATTLEAILAEQLVQRRVTTDVIGGFAAAALALAALGLYGLLAVMVASRKREIGVRLAVGASPGSVARRILIESLRTAALGITLGIAVALLMTRVIQHLLVGVSPRDPWTLASAAALLVAVAACAAVLPAWRAARVDPVEVLRSE